MDYPGEKSLIHFLKMLERNGIAPSIAAWKLRREGAAAIDVHRAQMLAVAQTEMDISRIQSGEYVVVFDGGGTNLPRLVPVARPSSEVVPVVCESPVSEAFTNLAIRTLRKELNVARTLVRAGEVLLEGSEPPPSDYPDPDWLERWRENASSTSVERMQDLWAQVLVREVRRPGSFSLRAMDLLRCIDSREAAKIEKVAPLAVNGRFIFVRRTTDESERWIAFGEAVELQELGILAGVGGSGIGLQMTSTSSDDFSLGVRVGPYGLGLRGEDASLTVQLTGFKITAIGSEILQLVAAEPEVSYVEDVGLFLKQQGLNVSLGRVLSDVSPGISQEFELDDERAL
ncbi:hypothetical protein C1925_12675 [Stenotrophomonas sp. SAU14A_NAIMI4_5]|uniref:DUF2806 domain-containing protein n=1 Tax=Stenotrophomonas sp. SAU14A_NAIMI4_5 TaxID=2072413 RepID=UPI000D5412AB|nr:DUF2806 domain-containing protein [Stenotrophomonas sp. SAU14A_NAIMI4_5]AWH49940.1 hypothetical protein C1925_12675 [Stenotrophomonas sp. SAU14A_NAIMI4_5]